MFHSFAMADADGGAHCWDGSGVRVNQGGSYRRNRNMTHCGALETSAKAE
ncbi:hypothetical protein X742_22465 [Mesorhizobium sp. LNHC232B00]|nr:hypothetical protein X742_22465 [Mesorhizobium sp. LNHC232B00]